MSWSGSVTARYADAADAITNIAVSPDSDAPEQVAQVTAAKAAATELVKSGVVVNDESQDVSVTIAGHANPDQKPPAGFAGDSLSVSLYQVQRTTADA